MALTEEFKLGWNSSRRRARRIQVVLFFIYMVWGLLDAGPPLGWGNLGRYALPYIIAIGSVYRIWKRRQSQLVGSLDDRAVLEYGIEFEKLGKAARDEILRRYRVGTFLESPDERQAEVERDAPVRAYAALRWLVPVLAVVYWAGWRLLPEGRVRAGWTDGPVVLAWVLLLVLALPQMIQMWTEPDEAGELQLAQRREA